jgi:hypothetical protein
MMNTFHFIGLVGGAGAPELTGKDAGMVNDLALIILAA